MKSINIFRHSRLQFPYDHWRNLTYMQFKELTEGRADPGIDPLYKGFEVIDMDIKKIEIILTSNKKRAKETAEKIVRCRGVQMKIVNSEIFNEIPSKILIDLTEHEWHEMRKRDKLQIHKKRVLNEEQTIDRISKIETFLKNLDESRILVVSHSYLVGVLNYWYNGISCNKSKFDLSEVRNYEIGGYLEGFLLNLP